MMMDQTIIRGPLSYMLDPCGMSDVLCSLCRDLRLLAVASHLLGTMPANGQPHTDWNGGLRARGATGRRQYICALVGSVRGVM